MKIRPYRDSDFTAITDIYAKSKLDELSYEEQDFALLPLEQDPKRLAEFNESVVYVYEDDSVVAYGALFGSEIRALFVDPSNRGKGIGKQLLEFLIAEIGGAVSLHVAKSNRPARTLYENYGFSVVEEFESIYNGVAVRACRMTRATPIAENS